MYFMKGTILNNCVNWIFRLWGRRFWRGVRFLPVHIYTVMFWLLSTRTVFFYFLLLEFGPAFTPHDRCSDVHVVGMLREKCVGFSFLAFMRVETILLFNSRISLRRTLVSLEVVTLPEKLIGWQYRGPLSSRLREELSDSIAQLWSRSPLGTWR